MADYQAMYTVLFRRVTAAIEELQDVQRQTEEMYISSTSTNIRLIDTDKKDDEAAEIQ
ncbi:MAG: hypothetical protein ACK5I7_05885 [Anaerotignum sp.]